MTKDERVKFEIPSFYLANRPRRMYLCRVPAAEIHSIHVVYSPCSVENVHSAVE